MGNTNSCIRHFQEVFSPWIGASRLQRSPTTLGRSKIEEKIDKSKVHWSLRVKFESNSKGKQVAMARNVKENVEFEVSEEEAELAKVSNMEEFKTLQAEWGSFFYTFGDGELVMDNFRFAAGSQAELYGARVEWRNPNWRKLLQRDGVLIDPPEYVLKVFRKGTYLRDLKANLPPALLDFHKKRVGEWTKRRYNCDVVCATLLEDGRFAFVLQREDEDLRDLIDRHMSSRTAQDHGPFPKGVAEHLMYEVAEGMNWLHEHDIVHRDLKASNVLVTEDNNRMCCFVTDYECSVGVEGTGFWRAPEILQAFKNERSVRDVAGRQRCRSERQKLFTKKADVYSYGMTCYEILSGRLPFEGHKNNEYDVVLNRQWSLEVPEYVDNWARELLYSCWQFDPAHRPSFGEILKRLRENSAAIQGNPGMDVNMAHSKANWSQNKTQLFTKSELIRQVELMRAMAIQAGQISQTFWSLPSEVEDDSDLDTEGASDNLRVFLSLQAHPTWGCFFQTFGYDTEIHEREGELEVGSKFAEGGQAELFDAHVTWSNPERNKYDLENGRKWVLKAYRKGTLLRYLQMQWPQGMLQFQAERMEFAESGTTFEWKKPTNVSDVVCGTLLEDGRFANLLEKYQCDLRDLIDRNMQLRFEYDDHPPFSNAVSEGMMYNIALGMDWLHKYNIVHRDLKASNVLIRKDRDGIYHCFICDYEASIGVVGTGLWRAPEILQAIKDKKVSERPEIFSYASDIYSYGMICYEILTGKIPFEGHTSRDHDLVLNGQRPEVPDYVEGWVRELLSRCWKADPAARPSSSQILKLFETAEENRTASLGEILGEARFR